MTEIKDVKVYDLEECIIASGYAMRIEPYDYLNESSKGNLDKHLKRGIKLVKASKNSDIHCHDNFLTGIRVSFDIKYPQYLSPEMQRYHFFDIITSMSKMHRLTKMDIRKSCNKYTDPRSIAILEEKVARYRCLQGDLEATDEQKYTAFMEMVSSCPLGLELWMRVSTNYKQLQTIYYQRRYHKLKEDWGAVINMIEGLPYFKEFILGDKPDSSVYD